MGAKKKGKKKSSSNAGKKGTKSDDAGAGAVSGELEVLSLSSTPTQLNNVSSLLFDSKNYKVPFALPFIGPISLAEREKGSVVVSHGRGLVVQRDVSPGECLFVIPSIISADAAEVRRRYLQEVRNDDSQVSIEKMTEEHLLEKVKSLCEIVNDEEIQPTETGDHARRLLRAFTAQMGSDEVPKIEKPEEWMDILVANDESSSHSDKADKPNLDRDAILSIIRRNAFGPDYHNYDKIEKCWKTKANRCCYYNRLLGVYPLSAMINHSCSPNAVRVFGFIPKDKGTKLSDIDNIQGREAMIVHANSTILKGTEITWSYLPPSTPFATRREVLHSRYGFTCKCGRCTSEEVALLTPDFKKLWALADGYWTSGETTMTLVPSLEKTFASKQLSNEQQRYLRVGYSKLYMDFFNAAFTQNDENIRQILQMATQLHFSCISCNNASTEHLSILHLCYHLATHLRVRAVKGDSPEAKTKTTSQVHFWTEQLKRAHMVRYGELGEDLETVRDAMKHTKLVLRNPEGWYLANDRFI